MKLGLIIFLLSITWSSMMAAQGRIDSLVVYDVDQHAQFEGGVAGWNRFVQEHLDVGGLMPIDSAEYVDYGFKQVAIVEFTVCEDGLVCDVEIVNESKISPEFAEEALRVMGESPKWTPARKDGRPVRTRFKQSVVAVL